MPLGVDRGETAIRKLMAHVMLYSAHFESQRSHSSPCKSPTESPKPDMKGLQEKAHVMQTQIPENVNCIP